MRNSYTVLRMTNVHFSLKSDHTCKKDGNLFLYIAFCLRLHVPGKWQFFLSCCTQRTKELQFSKTPTPLFTQPKPHSVGGSVRTLVVHDGHDTSRSKQANVELVFSPALEYELISFLLPHHQRQAVRASGFSNTCGVPHAVAEIPAGE